jgi:hypothetical protein
MSIWQQDRIPGAVNRYALGTWLPRRKLASGAFVPGQRAKRQLRGGRPFWVVFDFPLGANQTREARQTIPNDFILTHLMVSNTVGGSAANPGSRLQIFDAKVKKRFSVMPSNDTNIAGSAKDPFILRRPYRFRSGATILVRAQNLQSSANTVQLVMHGVQD